MKKYLLLAVVLPAVLSAACAAQTQNLKFFAVNLRPDGVTPTTIHFYCSRDYDKAECLKDATALRTALAPYPLQLLGEWSYYVVMADDWKPLVLSQNGNPVSPAFSLLLGRATVFDRRLFSPTPERTKELELWSGLPINVLVDVAVTHEMGHAICQEKSERRADGYGKALREGKVPDCSETTGSKMSSQTQSVMTATTNSNQLENEVINSQPVTVKAPDNSDGVSAGSNTGVSELYRHPQVLAALREIWIRAGGGLLKTEGAFTYDKDAGVKLVPPTNQHEMMTFEIPQTTQAIFHTHPAGQNRMSQNDIDTANQNHVDIYVLSRDGLYFYRPGMKAPQLVVIGTEFLGEKGGAK